MPLALRLGSLVVVALLAVTGCGSDGGDASSPGSSSESAEPAPTVEASATEAPGKKKPQGTTIDITFSGESVRPDGVRRKVAAGKPITLHIKADRPGELHVHSSPEQQVAYPAGITRKQLTIRQPGLVDVESHDLGRLVVQLEVR